MSAARPPVPKKQGNRRTRSSPHLPIRYPAKRYEQDLVPLLFNGANVYVPADTRASAQASVPPGSLLSRPTQFRHPAHPTHVPERCARVPRRRMARVPSMVPIPRTEYDLMLLPADKQPIIRCSRWF